MTTTLENLTLAIVPSFIVLDLLYRARRFAPTRWWRARAFVVTVVAFFFSGVVATFWANLIGPRSVFDLSGLGTALGAVVGLLVMQTLHYGYHRLAHGWNWLWRASHQMHHSAESLDAFGAYYLHPIDVVGFTTLASLVFFPLLGLTPMAGAIGALFLTFNAVFQHANVRTPRWLGYVIQRPESHSIHHARGVHRCNYADLPLIDMIFGTFRNPRTFADEVGLEPGASARIGSMLIGRDVGGESTPDASPRPMTDPQAAWTGSSAA